MISTCKIDISRLLDRKPKVRGRYRQHQQNVMSKRMVWFGVLETKKKSKTVNKLFSNINMCFE